MVDKPNSSSAQPNTATGTPKPAAASGRRGTDMRDAVAELAERAQLISQEAGTKVAAAMKDVISAGAGIAGFAIESARDLVNYMVKRGQMTQEEGDNLIRDAEAAHERRPASEKSRPTATKIAAEKAAAEKAEAAARSAAAAAAAPPFRAARPVVPPAGVDNGGKPKPAANPVRQAAVRSPHAAKAASAGPKKTAPVAAVKAAAKAGARAGAKAGAATAAKPVKPTAKPAAKKTAKPATKRGKK